MSFSESVVAVVLLAFVAMMGHVLGWAQGRKRGIREGEARQRMLGFATGGSVRAPDPDVLPIGCARAEVVRGTGHGAEVDRLVLRGVAEGFAMHRLEFGGGGVEPNMQVGVEEFLLQEIEESRRVFPNDQRVTLGQHHEEPISTAYPKLAAARARVDAVLWAEPRHAKGKQS